MSILYPMFALVLLSCVIGILLGVLRFRMVQKRLVNPKLYRVMKGYDEPEILSKISRNFSNLFETPILFYSLGATMLALNIESPTLLLLAWIYVALRLVHSIIHITYNTVLHRLAAFAISCFVLLAMWIILVMQAPVA